MHIVHLAEPRIVLLLNDAYDITRAWLVRHTYRPPECVIRLWGMTATPYGRPEIDDDHLATDALGCMRLLAWTIDRYPTSSPATLRNRFDRLFVHDPTDALVAGLRIFAGTCRQAPGEQATFCSDQWWRHPAEMAAIATMGALHQTGLTADW